ncbi:EthD domain-containing protein [Cercophora scortea]|uniref:EthD domain-containing protein n=1 Tax=Cercophora scortea TaxID=314031 RepID=A0AAE0MGU7_9PEZI|nr:EthD domain-containing protein [Cercophora scortea]
MGSTTPSPRLFSLTIFGYRKEGMSEKDYHDYVSETHSGHLTALLAKNEIVSYTMQHNTTEHRRMLAEILPEMPAGMESDCDLVVQIIFKDLQDYLRVRNDRHYAEVVGPDHANFADPHKTRFVTGWYEVHISDGRVVAAQE